MDTICAVITGMSKSAVGIIRLSGPQAVAICSQILQLRNGTLAALPSARLARGAVFDGAQQIDDVLAVVFRAPASFTGEDVVEISCHGALSVLQRVLSLLVRHGCTLAGPGEFSKRAFLNGKLDLIQAEAICDLINSETALQSKLALSRLAGGLSQKISGLVGDIIAVNTDIMAYVDFPDEGLGAYDAKDTLVRLEKIAAALVRLLASARGGAVIRDGIATAIVGAPNVGKSTLLNQIVGYERSIVSDIPGTTRDMVSEAVVCGGVQLHLMDTAGIRGTADAVESIGVSIAKDTLEAAALLFCVFDGSKTLTENDRNIITLTADKTAIAVINKADLPQKIDKEYIERKYQHIVYVSAKNGMGMDKLAQLVESLFLSEVITADGADIIVSARHYEKLTRAAMHVNDALEAIRAGFAHDLVATDLTGAAAVLGEMTGQAVSEQMIDDIFSKFCVGK